VFSIGVFWLACGFNDFAIEWTMTLDQLLEQLKDSPVTVEFNDVMAVIETYYDYTATAFQNGDVLNPSGSNEGSCKIFAFATLQGLSEQATLACFGRYYRDDVMLHPEGDDHGNIRSFISNGWQGVSFKGQALSQS